MSVFVADGQNDRVSIVTGSSRDLAAEANPLAHMDKVIFHSDLPYVEIVNKVSGSVQLPPPQNQNYGYTSEIDLFAHGLDYTPMILCQIHNVYDINGVLHGTVPFNGSVPNARRNPVASPSYVTFGFANIVANATHIRLVNHFHSRGVGSEYQLPVLDYTVHITNVALEGNDPQSSGSGLIRIEDGLLEVAGKFSSASRHVSSGGAGISAPLMNGMSMTGATFDFYCTAYRSAGGNVAIPAQGIYSWATVPNSVGDWNQWAFAVDGKVNG